VDSLDAVKQEKHLFALAKFFSHYGLCSDPVGPMVVPRRAKTCPTQIGLFMDLDFNNANKKILELSWLYLEHPLDMSDFVGPHRSKIWKKRRADPIVKDQARNSVDRKSDNTDSI
jgi:hypothetical protein